MCQVPPSTFRRWYLATGQSRILNAYHFEIGISGTAVNVQAMVFGNWSESSGTGVLFTRDPCTGENKLYGEYLMNAQGEVTAIHPSIHTQSSQVHDPEHPRLV